MAMLFRRAESCAVDFTHKRFWIRRRRPEKSGRGEARAEPEAGVRCTGLRLRWLSTSENKTSFQGPEREAAVEDR